MTAPARRLGPGGPLTGPIGLGCMGLSEFYAPVARADAVATIRRALELGMTLLDTSDMYGIGENERLLGEALRGRRDRAVVATKAGILRDPNAPGWRGVDGSPGHLRAACDASLRRLGVEHIDLWYLHRADPGVPIEESIGAMRECVTAGKVRRLGVSELDAGTLRRAAATAPLAAIQSEYSLFTRDVERNGVRDAARELGIALVAYAPLGRGMLTGASPATHALASDDLRRRVPRYDPGNVEHNLALVDALGALARERGCTPAQLALAWVLAQGDDVVALPGCERVAHVEENARAAEIALDDAMLTRIDALVPPGAAAGARIR